MPPPGRAARSSAFLRAGILLASMSFGVLGFVLPVYAKHLGASALDIGGIISIFAVMITLARPLVGRGIDRFGRKPFLAGSFVFYALAMYLMSLAGQINMLYLARFVQGIGSSLLWIPAYAVVTELEARDRGRAVGRVDGAASFGATLGAFLGFGVFFSPLSFDAGWRLLFSLYAALALVGGLLVWRFVPETRTAPPAGEAPSDAGSAIDRPRLYRLMIVVFITGLSYSMISPLLLIFLQDRFTTDVGRLAWAYIPAALVSSFLPGRAGHLSDRLGRAPLMAAGMIGAGLVSLFVPSLSSLTVLTILWMIEAVGFSMASPAEAALVADLTGEQARGAGFGMYTFAQGIGFIIGPLLGGWLYDTAGHAFPFYLNGAVLLLASLLVWLLLGRRKAA
jgi:MFS family permease